MLFLRGIGFKKKISILIIINNWDMFVKCELFFLCKFIDCVNVIFFFFGCFKWM